MSNEPRSDDRSWRPRFGLGMMMLVTFVFSVMGASGYYLVQSLRAGGNSRLAFILFSVASPLLLLVVASAGQTLFAWWQRRK